MVIIIIIGILSGLAYASLMELISINRAKETAQTMRSFAERAIAEGKRLGKDVEITVNGNSIKYAIKEGNAEIEQKTELLSDGFSKSSASPNCMGELGDFQNSAVSEFRIGTSGIAGNGYFAACGANGYCGAAVKTKNNNAFVACIKRAKSLGWERL